MSNLEDENGKTISRGIGV